MLVLACVVVASLGKHKTNDAVTLPQLLIILAAIWCAAAALMRLRKIIKKPSDSSLGRWRAGHLLCLSGALAVGLWGLLLREIGGRSEIADLLFTTSVLLLFMWRPGIVPGTVKP